MYAKGAQVWLQDGRISSVGSLSGEPAGGALSLHDCNTLMQNVTIELATTDNAKAGCLAVLGGQFVCDRCVFSRCAANQNDGTVGAVWMGAAVNATLQDTDCVSSGARQQGCLLVDGEANVQWHRGTIGNNNAQISIIGIEGRRSALLLAGVRIMSNTVTSFRGVVDVMDGGKLTLSNGTIFADNQGVLSGALYLYDSGEFPFYDCGVLS